MPIAPPGQTGLQLARPPSAPHLMAVRAEPAPGASAPDSEFKVGGTNNAAVAAESGKTASPETFRRFEAMVLQTFIQNMLPKDGAAVYGKGTAGEMWKSLLAQNMAEVMAERGGIGIADKMLGAHYAKPVEAAADPTPMASVGEGSETIGRFLVAPAVLDGMQRALSDLLAGEISPSPANEAQSNTSG